MRGIFTCPGCGAIAKIDRLNAGQTFRCACGTQFSLPFTFGMRFTVFARILGVLVVCGFIVAMMLPAVGVISPEQSRRMRCVGNLRLIGQAFHNYHDMYKTFPPAYIADGNGHPRHSWRDLLVPFIFPGPASDQYDPDAPLTAPQNLAVVREAWRVFSCRVDHRHEKSPAAANYVVLTGPGTIFEHGKTPKISWITDGTFNTILAVELPGPYRNWRLPRDLDIENFVAMFGPDKTPDKTTPHPGGLNVLFADGTVHFLSIITERDTIRALATCAGGENVDRPE